MSAILNFRLFHTAQWNTIPPPNNIVDVGVAFVGEVPSLCGNFRINSGVDCRLLNIKRGEGVERPEHHVFQFRLFKLHRCLCTNYLAAQVH